jgi:hypothetical protein
MREDRRPPFVLEDVTAAAIAHVKAQKAGGVPSLMLKNVRDFSIHASAGIADTNGDQAEWKAF